MKISEIAARFQMISYRIRKLFKIKRQTRRNSESDSIIDSSEDLDRTRRNVHKALALSMGENPDNFHFKMNFAHRSLAHRQSSNSSFGSARHGKLNQQSSNSSGGSYSSHSRLGTRFSSNSVKSNKSRRSFN